MPKRLLILVGIVLIVAIAGLTIGNLSWWSKTQAHKSVQPGKTTLKISPQGSQMTTDVSGGDLQQAAPPNGSATSPDLNPQQSKPNYCAGSEVPFQDGCLPSQ